MPQQSGSGSRTVNCPGCGTPVAWVRENRWRPFCSERCKTLDFGAWAMESYRVTTSPPEGEEDGPPPGDNAR